MAACSSLQSVQAPALPPAPAPVLDLPHPGGFSSNELKELFTLAKAPEPKALRGCTDDFMALARKTQLREELRAGARELMIENPSRYHWCFYQSLLELDERLQKPISLDERRGLTLSTFSFAIATARAFQVEFKDTRYLRWAIQRYRSLSPIVFHRRVELSAEATAELAVIENPFGIWKPAPDPQSILKKYGMREEQASRAPASAVSPQPAPPAQPTLSDEAASKLFDELERP